MSDARLAVRPTSSPAAAASIVLAAVLATACRETPAATPTPTVSADTWAVVNGKAITRDDVEKAYRRTPNAGQTLSEEEALTAKLNLLNDLVLEEILVAKAGQLKIDVAQSELDTAYNEAKSNIPDDAFRQELSKRSLTPADMREGLRRQLLGQKVMQQEVGSKVSVSDKDVSDFFTANRAQFNVAEESYQIAQIVVTPMREPQASNASGDDAASPQAAAAKVQMLMERLKSGASFRDLARGYSEDGVSAARGGDLGLVPVSRLRQAPQALRDAVLNKAPGSVSVVSAGRAHTIVLVVAHEPAGQRDLSTPGVRERITETLRARKEQLLRTAYVIAARSDATVVNYAARRLVESNGAPPTLRPSAPGAQ